MAVRLTALTAPANAALGSGPFKITPTIANPDKIITAIGTDETGAAVTITINIHENMTLSTSPADIVGGKAKPGIIVLQASASDGSPVPLSVDADKIEWDSSV